MNPEVWSLLPTLLKILYVWDHTEKSGVRVKIKTQTGRQDASTLKMEHSMNSIMTETQANKNLRFWSCSLFHTKDQFFFSFQRRTRLDDTHGFEPAWSVRFYTKHQVDELCKAKRQEAKIHGNISKILLFTPVLVADNIISEKKKKFCTESEKMKIEALVISDPHF